MSRWQKENTFAESNEEVQRKKRQKYNTGRMHEFGDGYNPLNYEYEKSPRGPKVLETDSKKAKLTEIRK